MQSIRGWVTWGRRMRTWPTIWRSWSPRIWSTTSRSRVWKRRSSQSRPIVRSKKGGRMRWMLWWTAPNRKSTRRSNPNRRKSRKLQKIKHMRVTSCRPFRSKSRTRSTSMSSSGSLSRTSLPSKRKRSPKLKPSRSSRRISRFSPRKPPKRWRTSRRSKNWLSNSPKNKKPWGNSKITWFPKGTWQLGGRMKSRSRRSIRGRNSTLSRGKGMNSRRISIRNSRKGPRTTRTSRNRKTSTRKSMRKSLACSTNARKSTIKSLATRLKTKSSGKWLHSSNANRKNTESRLLRHMQSTTRPLRKSK